MRVRSELRRREDGSFLFNPVVRIKTLLDTVVSVLLFADHARNAAEHSVQNDVNGLCWYVHPSPQPGGGQPPPPLNHVYLLRATTS